MSVDPRQYEEMSARAKARAAFRMHNPVKDDRVELSAREKSREAFKNPNLEENGLNLNLKGRTPNNLHSGIKHDPNCAKPCCDRTVAAAEHICIDGDGCNPFDSKGHVHTAGDGCLEDGIKVFNTKSEGFEKSFGNVTNRELLKKIRIGDTIRPAAAISECASRTCGHDHKPKPAGIEVHKNCKGTCCYPKENPASSITTIKAPYVDSPRIPYSGIEKVNNHPLSQVVTKANAGEMIQIFKPVNRIAEIVDNLPYRIPTQQNIPTIPIQPNILHITLKHFEHKTSSQDIRPKNEPAAIFLQYQHQRHMEQTSKASTQIVNRTLEHQPQFVKKQNSHATAHELLVPKIHAFQLQKIKTAAKKAAPKKEAPIKNSFIIKSKLTSYDTAKIASPTTEMVKNSLNYIKRIKEAPFKAPVASSKTNTTGYRQEHILKIQPINKTPLVQSIAHKSSSRPTSYLGKSVLNELKNLRADRVANTKTTIREVSHTIPRQVNARPHFKEIISKLPFIRAAKSINSEKVRSTARLSALPEKVIQLKKILQRLPIKTSKYKTMSQGNDSKHANIRTNNRIVFNNLIRNLEQKIKVRFTVENGLSLSILKAFKVYKITRPKTNTSPNYDIKKGVSKLLQHQEFTKHEKHIIFKTSEVLFRYFEERLSSLKSEELWLYLLMLLGIKKRKALDKDEEFQKLLSEFIGTGGLDLEPSSKEEKLISLIKHILTHYSHLLDYSEKNALKERYDLWNSQMI